MKRLSGIILSLIFSLGIMSGCDVNSGKGSIKVAYFTGGFGTEWMKEMAKDFTTETNITVSFEASNTITRDLETYLESEVNIPDAFLVLLTNWRSWATQGWLEPLDDIYNKEYTLTENGKNSSVKIKDYLNEGFQTYGKMKQRPSSASENYWVIPWTNHVTGFVYNENVLQELGWAKAPETETELKQLISDINGANLRNSEGTQVKPFAWGGKEIKYWNYVVMAWWAQYEGMNKWNEFWNFPNPEVYLQEGRVEALRLFQDIVGSEAGWINSINNLSEKDHIDAARAFLKGEAVMMPTSAFFENEMQGFFPTADPIVSGKNFSYKMMTPPLISGAKAGAALNNSEAGDFMGVPSKAKNKDGGKKFIEFINRPENIRKFSVKTGMPRPFQTVYSDANSISLFIKDCFAIYESTEQLYKNSNSALYHYKDLNEWVGVGENSVYSSLSGKNIKPPTDVNKSVYNYAKSNWKRWCNELGIPYSG